MSQRFEDFILNITYRSDGTYNLVSSTSQGRYESGTLTLPVDYNTIAAQILPTEDALSEVCDWSGLFYQALFPGKIGDSLKETMRQCRKKGMNLRILLRFDGAEAEMVDMFRMPWELAGDEPTPLALQTDVSFVRYLETSDQTPSLPWPSPLKILVVLSKPDDLEAFDVQGPADSIQQAWQGADVEINYLCRSNLKQPTLGPPTLTALRKALKQGYHILHFTGHGGQRQGKWGLAFEDEEGKTDLVTGQEMAPSLRGSKHLRLVNLVSCDCGRADRQKVFNPFNGVAQALVLDGMAAVTAMQFPITIKGAAAYTAELYEELARQKPITVALDHARNALFERRNGLEWATPVLFMRTKSGRVFDPPKLERVKIVSIVQEDHKQDDVRLLDFTGYFKGGRERSKEPIAPDIWQNQILDQLHKLKENLDYRHPLEFSGRAWLPIWLATGLVFCNSSAFKLSYLQYNQASKETEIWDSDKDVPLIRPEVDKETVQEPSSQDLVVAISAIPNKHRIDETVRDCLTKQGINYKSFLSLKPPPSGPWLSSEESLGLALGMAEKISDVVNTGVHHRVHLFVASSAGFGLFLGRWLNTLNLVVYAHGPTGFVPAFSFPST